MFAPKSERWIRSQEMSIDDKGQVAIGENSAISEHDFDHMKSACSIFGNMFLCSYLKCISEKEINKDTQKELEMIRNFKPIMIIRKTTRSFILPPKKYANCQ